MPEKKIDRRSLPLSELMDRYLRRVDPQGRRFDAEAVEAWPKIAGPDIARHTAAYAVKKGALLVETDSSVWAMELASLAPRYVEAVNGELGRNVVRGIRFTVKKGGPQYR